MNQNQANLEPEEPLLPSPSLEMLAYMEKLYPLIFAFKQAKLWKSIRDSEPFAIQMPDGQTGCCILTGNEGDFISLSIYFGDAGWNSICDFYSEPVETEEARLEQMMSQSCVQVVFCRKDGLTETEVQSLRHYARENNIAFRGKNAYFCLRNSEPYHCSWFLETKEQADILELGLRAALDLHKQLGQGKTPTELGISSCIDTLPLYDGKTWSTMMPPERTVSSLTEPLLSDAMQQKIRRMKKGGGKWECQLFPFSSPVLAKEGAPFFPFLLMILDTKREQLLPQQPLQYNADILQKALDSFVQAIIDYGRCPKSIAVCDERTEAILSELCHKCGILLLKTTRFAMLDEAKASFLEDMEAEKQADDAESEKIIATFVEHLKDMTVEEIKDDAPLDVIRWLMVSDIPEDLMKKLEKVMEELQ